MYMRKINHGFVELCREKVADGFINGAMKVGNATGAKEPCFGKS